MKKISLMFAWVLMIFALQTHLLQAQMEITSMLESWSDSSSDASTFLFVDGYTSAFVFHVPAGNYNFEYWAVSGTAYAYASGDSMGDNTWYDATAWCEASGDENTSPTPGRDNIDKGRISWDSNGKPYYSDSHIEGDAEIAYLAHSVGTDKLFPWSERKTRTLSLSVYRSYYSGSQTSPTGLTAEPEMSASIEGDSNQFVNRWTGSASISDPD